MSDTSTLNSEQSTLSANASCVKGTLNLETGQSNLKETISYIKLQNKSNLRCNKIRCDKILLFISLIINGASVVLLNYKEVNKVGIFLYLISWIFLFSRIIRM